MLKQTSLKILSTRAVKLLKARVCMRARDFYSHGIHSAALARLCQQGHIIRVGRGLYELPNIDITEHHSLLVAQQRVSHGVICLLSALQFHELTTQMPHEVWMAIDRKAWRPKQDYPPIRLIYFGSNLLQRGIKAYRVEGEHVQITTPARTVADCFKYRNKIGLDVALEALRDYRRKRAGSIDELLKAAKDVRVSNVIRSYLEALL